LAYYEKDITEIQQSIINNIHDAWPQADTKQGTFISNVFINPISDEIAAMYGDMKLLRLSQSVLTAVGDDLDYLASNYFIVRKSATKSSGKVRFYLKNTNKSVTLIKDTDLEDSITIPYGTVVSSVGTYTSTAIQFQTTESLVYTRDEIKQLSIDGDTGYRYIEAAAESVATGEDKNIAAGVITSVVTTNIKGIAFVSNPYAFYGGTDAESDTSLARRIELAITGSNIGTKDGYLSFCLGQNGVVNAKVVGAGDNIMFRDGGYINDNGEYQFGMGGCVDIYIRGHQNMESTYNFTVSSDYLHGTTNFSNIILPKQPVNEIISIISTTTGKNLINASTFETEKYTMKDPLDSSKTKIETKYCKDILWDFSITDTFPDTDYYSLPQGMTQEQIKNLKNKVDVELKDALLYLSNMMYSIDWGSTSERTTEGGSTELFKKIYYNNGVYKIIAKDNTGLDGRMFIMKNDKIYVRIYMQPDYILQKDITNYAGSMVAQDSIKWLNTSQLILNDVLIIKYNYDYLIEHLQTTIETKRCLTADVLVKQAIEVPVEIIATLACYNYDTVANIKKIANTRLTTWINTLQSLGGEFDKSDIVALLKESETVDSVDLDTLQIAIKGYAPQNKLACADNEYFVVSNIILNVAYSKTIRA
jgi:uncharacterized phage protein gp47/JayE